MGKYDEIKDELVDLINDGKKLREGLSLCVTSITLKEMPKEDFVKASFFFNSYEKWYTKALTVVKILLPDRYLDFSLLYKNDKRKDLHWNTYTISDAVQQIVSKDKSLHPYRALKKLEQQVWIVEACQDKFESRLFNIHTVLQADVFDSEIESARHLLSRGFLRAAGAICGVVIEKHFSFICQNHSIEIKKKNPSIADYNDAQKDIIYDTVEWRKIQRFADLRNLCDHNKEREPSKDEVDELIYGTERIIKTIF